MKKFNKEGLRFIIGTLVAAVTAVLVASIISTSLGTLALAIRESNTGSSQPSASSQPTSSAGNESSSSTTPSSSSPSSSESLPVIHQVTFNPSGGSAISQPQLQIKHGEFILNFPVTNLTNHQFLGWYTGITPSDILFTGAMPVVQDMTLFARWELLPEPPTPEPGAVTWIVAFDANGGTPVSSLQIADGRTFQLPISNRQGYVFLGWYTGILPGDIQFTSATPVLRNITLYARWERQSFMITFLTYGGTFVSPLTAQADQPIQAPAQPTKLNQSFVGWYRNLSDVDTYPFNLMPEESFTLHAKWADTTFDGLQFTCSSSACLVTGYEGIHSRIYIPATYEDLPVTAIADYAFEGNTTLASIIFPEGSEVKTIGRAAFANMPSLMELNLPTSLKTIKDEAFKGVTMLEQLEIPLSVTRIGTNLLTGMDSLERLAFSFQNNRQVSASFNFKYFFGGTAFNSAVVVPNSLKKIEVIEGTTTIPNDALRDLPLVQEVYMPTTATSIGNNVLNGATSLTDLTWIFTTAVDATSVSSVNSYLGYAFGTTFALIAGIPSNLRNVSIHPLPTTVVNRRIAAQAFFNIATLRTIELPSDVTEIGNQALAHSATGTSQLTNLELPSTLKTLGNSVFQNSSALVELSIPDGVTAVGTSLLVGTTNLQILRVGIDAPALSTNRFFRYFYGGTAATTGGTLPTNLLTVELSGGTSLMISYLEGFTSVQTVFLPTSLTTIGNRAFFGMTGLRQMQVTGAIAQSEKVILPQSATTLGTAVFQGATNLIHVTLPSALTAIPDNTFNGATSLEEVVTGPSMITIGASAFFNSKLTRFTFSNDLTTIGLAAFQGTLIQEVKLPNTVLNIGNDAFRSMPSLTKIEFPTTILTTLGTNVLTGTQSLTTVSIHIDSLPVGTRVLRYLFGGTITVATGTLPTTLNTVTLTGGATLTGTFFQGHTNLTTINLPVSLTVIGASAFQGATGIVSLVIPSTVDNLGTSAFNGMSGLLQLTFLRTTQPTTLGTTIFANTNVGLFIIVPSDALVNYTNAQFTVFGSRLVETQANPT